MLGFAYSVALKLLYPTSISLILLLAAAVLGKRRVASQFCLWGGIAVLMVCGNGWVVGGLTRHLERWHTPPQSIPRADSIVILGGGIWGQIPPRPSIEVGEGGDRLLYGAALYRQGKAPEVICTGGIATGGFALRPAAETMAEFVTGLGVPAEAIITETESSNTHEHAVRLCPSLTDRGVERVLLVTSAMHMPRSMAVFERECPEIQFIAAPTDFLAPDRLPSPWYREITHVLPTPMTLLRFSEVTHEYLGLAYYWLRGWI